MVGEFKSLLSTAGNCFCHVIKPLNLMKIKSYMSNVKTIKYNKVSGGSFQITKVKILAIDNNDLHTSYFIYFMTL